MELTNVQEEYLKTIYLFEKDNKKVRITDIAKKLNKTKPTVNYAINSLKEEGLLNYQVYGNISLTKDGELLAIKILEAYDIVYLFLNEILNKLAVYVHKTLGLYDLDCGYNIGNYRCIKCSRRTKKKEGDK